MDKKQWSENSGFFSTGTQESVTFIIPNDIDFASTRIEKLPTTLVVGSFVKPKGSNKKKDTLYSVSFFLEATPRFELGVELLQSSALPLGYGAE